MEEKHRAKMCVLAANTGSFHNRKLCVYSLVAGKD